MTSLIQQERIETTVAKAKAARPLAEWMITLAKHGDLAARRQAASYLLNPGAVKFLFEELSKRYATRAGGYTRLVHAGWRKGDGADVAMLELVDNEVLQRLAAKRAKKVEARRKAAEEAKGPRASASAGRRRRRQEVAASESLDYWLDVDDPGPKDFYFGPGFSFCRDETAMGKEASRSREAASQAHCPGTCGYWPGWPSSMIPPRR